MPRSIKWLAWLVTLAFFAAGCQRTFVYVSTPTGSSPQASAIPERTALLLEISGTVGARTSESAQWAAAVSGRILSEGSQIRTGIGGRAVIALTEGSRIYLGDDTEITIALLNPYLDSQLTALDLKQGEVWVLLPSGALDVQTPFGIATARTAYLSTEYLPQGRIVNVTCLQGVCGFGSVLIPSGYKLTGAAGNNQPEPMELADVGAWGQAVPEATQLAYLSTEAIAQGSATLPVVATSTLTPTPPPTATPTDSPVPAATETLAPETPSSTVEPPTATPSPSPTAFPSPTQPVLQPTVTPRPFTPLPPAPVIGQHIAQAGDTIFCIARGYGVLPVAIAQANNLPFPFNITTGQVLAIPAVQWLDISPGPVCATQFISPFPGLVVPTATLEASSTPAGPPLIVSIDFNCVANCGSSQGTYAVRVNVAVSGGIGPYNFDPGQSFDVNIPHCTDGAGTVTVTSADGQSASATWSYHDVSCT